MSVSKLHFNQASSNTVVQALIDQYNTAYKKHTECKLNNTKLCSTPQPPNGKGWEEITGLTAVAKKTLTLLSTVQNDRETLISLAEHVTETTREIIAEFHSVYNSQTNLYVEGFGLSRKHTSLMKDALSAITKLFRALNPKTKISSNAEPTPKALYFLKIDLEQLHDKLPFRLGFLSDIFEVFDTAQMNRDPKTVVAKPYVKAAPLNAPTRMHPYNPYQSLHIHQPVYGIKTQYFPGAQTPRPVPGIVGYK